MLSTYVVWEMMTYTAPLCYGQLFGAVHSSLDLKHTL